MTEAGPVPSPTATAPRAARRARTLALAGAAVGLAVGLAAGLLGPRLAATDDEAGGERQLTLVAGERLSIGRWALELKRAALVRRDPPRRLVLLLILTHDGEPSDDGGRYFHLPPDHARAPYRGAVAGVSQDGAATRLSFRVPPTADGPAEGPFLLRFAPPDHPSVRLTVHPAPR